MMDIYLTGKQKKRKRGWGASRPKLVLLLVLSCLAAIRVYAIRYAPGCPRTGAARYREVGKPWL